MKAWSFDLNKLQAPVAVFYDGGDAASAHEITFLQGKNSDNKLEFVDVASSPHRAADYGVSAAVVGNRLYARDASGQVMTGIDALFAAHAVIGLAAWFVMCRLPGFLSVGTGIGPKG